MNQIQTLKLRVLHIQFCISSPSQGKPDNLAAVARHLMEGVKLGQPQDAVSLPALSVAWAAQGPVPLVSDPASLVFHQGFRPCSVSHLASSGFSFFHHGCRSLRGSHYSQAIYILILRYVSQKATRDVPFLPGFIWSHNFTSPDHTLSLQCSLCPWTPLHIFLRQAHLVSCWISLFFPPRWLPKSITLVLSRLCFKCLTLKKIWRLV